MFAFVFESVGSGEWLVLLAVILIVVGPRNLPSAARKMGQVMSKLRRAADEFKRQLMTMDEEMRKTADEIKHEYIDVPDSGAVEDHTASDSSASDSSSDENGSSDPAEHDYMDDYPEGYPDYESYGYGENGDGGEPKVESQAMESPSPSAVETASASPDDSGSMDVKDGKDTGNTAGS